MKKNIEKAFYFFIFISIFLLRIPSFYFLGIKSTLLATHTFALVLIVAYFFWKTIILYKKKLVIPSNIENKLIIVFLLAVSLSIFQAINVQSFLQVFLKIFIGVILFFLVRILITGYKDRFIATIAKAFLLAGMVSILLQFILLIFPETYFGIGEVFFYENHIYMVKEFLNAPKIIDDTMGEVVIPIFFYFFLTAKDKRKKLVYFLFFILAGCLAFLSNFRDRFMVFMFVSGTSMFFLFDRYERKKIFIQIIILCFVIFAVLDQGLRVFGQHSIYDRIFLQNDFRDLRTIIWRLDMIQQATVMASSSIFTGVGLGNFYENLPVNKNLPFSLLNTSSMEITNVVLKTGPHNIFFQFVAETGILGLGSLSLLLLFFLKKDITMLLEKKINTLTKAFIIAFWALLLFVQVHPAVSLSFFILFFLLRGLIVIKENRKNPQSL